MMTKTKKTRITAVNSWKLSGYQNDYWEDILRDLDSSISALI